MLLHSKGSKSTTPQEHIRRKGTNNSETQFVFEQKEFPKEFLRAPQEHFKRVQELPQGTARGPKSIAQKIKANNVYGIKVVR